MYFILLNFFPNLPQWWCFFRVVVYSRHRFVTLFPGVFLFGKTFFKSWCHVQFIISSICCASPIDFRLQNSRFFLSKSVKKSVKRGVRVLRVRSARASHARRACDTREKKSVSPQSRSMFSALFKTFFRTARAYLNKQKYGLFCSLDWLKMTDF